jgi:hypothetical protein
MKQFLLSTTSSLVLSALIVVSMSGSANAVTRERDVETSIQESVGDSTDVNPTNAVQNSKAPAPQPLPPVNEKLPQPIVSNNPTPVNPEKLSRPIVSNNPTPINPEKLTPIVKQPIEKVRAVKKAAHLSEDGNTFYDRNGNAYHKDGDIFYDHSGKNNNLTVDKKGRLKDAKGRIYGSVNPPKVKQPIKPIAAIPPVTIKLPAHDEIKQLANGFTVDGKGIIRKATGQPIAIVKEDGTFTNANGRPISKKEAHAITNLFKAPAGQIEDKKLAADELHEKASKVVRNSSNAKNAGFFVKSDGGSTFYGGDGNKDLSKDLRRIKAKPQTGSVATKPTSTASHGYTNPTAPSVGASTSAPSSAGIPSTAAPSTSSTPTTGGSAGGGGSFRDTDYNMQQH